MTVERAVLRIWLPPMHPGQLEVARHPARFRVLAAGRRWGKTRLGALLCLVEAVQGRRAWWVAPTYKMARVGWREIARLAAQVPGAEIRRGELMVLLPTGGEISVRSADRPDTLRGEGLDFLVLDEAAYADPETWSYVLRPALSDRQGGALLISTPKGLNWFHDLFRRGTAGEPGWAAWRFPTSTNPHIHPEEIEEARRQLPELVFRQEYLAEFLDWQGALFKREWIRYGEPAGPLPTYMGVDLAISTREGADYTAIAVISRDPEGRIWVRDVVRGRWTFHETLRQIASLAERWRPKLIAVEKVQYQAAVVQELLRTTKLPVKGVNPDRDKAARAMLLQPRYEQGLVYHSPSLPREFEDELLVFPEGEHDDQVDALVYAYEATGLMAGLTYEEQLRYASR